MKIAPLTNNRSFTDYYYKINVRDAMNSIPKNEKKPQKYSTEYFLEKIHTANGDKNELNNIKTEIKKAITAYENLKLKYSECTTCQEIIDIKLESLKKISNTF